MTCDTVVFFSVSMKSGLEDRNNADNIAYLVTTRYVSMKSGLEDRNNYELTEALLPFLIVSMKSGLEDRNNPPETMERRDLERLSQ